MGEPFESSRRHLYAELERLDLLLQRQVWRWRQVLGPQAGEFHGLYVSEAEVDAIVGGIYPSSEQILRQASAQDAERLFGQAIERAADTIRRRCAASAASGIPLRLERLRAMFGLTSFDMDAVLICLAPEIDLRYERLYAYLQDDVTRKRPAVSLILNLLCATSDEQLGARARFLPEAPLLQHHLLALVSDPALPHSPLLARCAKLDDRVVAFLLADTDRASIGLVSEDLIDPRLREACHMVRPDGSHVEQAAIPASLALTHEGDCPTVILLQGNHGAGKYDAARAACAAHGQPLLSVHLLRLCQPERDLNHLARLAAREAYLSGAALYWHGYSSLMADEGEDDRRLLQRETLHAALLCYPVTSFVPLEDLDRHPDPALLAAPRLVRVRFDSPSFAQRRALWQEALIRCGAAPGIDATSVAGRFRLEPGQIQDAVRDACHRAAQRSPGECPITIDDLFAAARARSGERLRGQAVKIEPRHSWDDLVLPEDQVAQLHELCDQIKYRHVVLGEWGFEGKLSTGRGLNVLLAGPSGTGKTMAAQVIARDLELDLFKIDLSTIVSKYVGETEKNLERIFGAARNSNAILLFDEADALFGKRSEVRDAHDRYANVEISYLLQKMDEYDGLVILTSNLSKNMDEAFVRRMHFTIEFPFPEQDARRQIWQIVFPAQAPLAAEVNLALLAERFRLTGANIRSVALTAAFLAARDGGVIGMQHLLWATRREYQKMGRLMDEREFMVTL